MISSTETARVVGMPTSPGTTRQRGVYVHIPFCVVRCGYCDFNAYAGMDDLKPAYVSALLKEIEAKSDGGKVTSIFIGGGTPTELVGSHLASIIEAVRRGFDVEQGETEITVEANPESLDPGKLRALIDAGVTRLSIGVQSTSPQVLAYLGRVHDQRKALDVLHMAVESGLSVNADLIYGSPGESQDELIESLTRVADAGVDHISAYALTVEEGTPLHSWVAKGAAAPPDEDDQADKYLLTRQVLADAGFLRYEVSNWARPGAWSRHNVVYWTADDHLGMGAGAHQHVDGRRSWNLKSPQAYIAASPEVEDGFESIRGEARLAEAVLLGLRLEEGIDRRAFLGRWGVDPATTFREELSPFVEEGLLLIDDDRLRIDPERMFLSGRVARALVAL